MLALPENDATGSAVGSFETVMEGGSALSQTKCTGVRFRDMTIEEKWTYMFIVEV